MINFEFKTNILKEYQLKRLEIYIKEQLEKMNKLKEELKNLAMSNELFFIKCSEFVEVVNNITSAQKEINERNKEKGVKQYDQHINEK